MVLVLFKKNVGDSSEPLQRHRNVVSGEVGPWSFESRRVRLRISWTVYEEKGKGRTSKRQIEPDDYDVVHPYEVCTIPLETPGRWALFVRLDHDFLTGRVFEEEGNRSVQQRLLLTSNRRCGSEDFINVTKGAGGGDYLNSINRVDEFLSR